MSALSPNPSPEAPTPEAPEEGATVINLAVGDLLVGAVIDNRYRVERFIGEGGMGRVYECSHVTFKKRLVLKTLIPEFTSQRGAFERFLQEAQIAAGVGSPHIVSVSDFGELADGRSYYVMEYVDGVSLEESLDALEGPMPVHRALQIIGGITRALGAAHDAGVVHRDLKPDNVLLCARQGQSDFVKVLDFGLAYVASESERITQRGELVGTPFYMAPEQCLDETVDHRADIYAIGVLLYEMLTLELPFHSESFAEVIRMKVAGLPEAPSSLEGCSHIPPAVDALVAHCMAVSPRDRVQNHHHLLRLLDEVLAPPSQEISGEEATLYAAAQPLRQPPPAYAPVSPAVATATANTATANTATANTATANTASTSKKRKLLIAGLIALTVAFLLASIAAAALGWHLSHPGMSPGVTLDAAWFAAQFRRRSWHSPSW